MIGGPGGGARAVGPLVVGAHVRYVLQRVVQFLIVFFIVTFGVMVLLRLGLEQPGDPARTMLGGGPAQEQIADDDGELPPRQQLLRPVLVLAEGDVATATSASRCRTACPSGRSSPTRIMTTVLLGFYA